MTLRRPHPGDVSADDRPELRWHELKRLLTVIRGQAPPRQRRLTPVHGVDGLERVWLLECGTRIGAVTVVMIVRSEQVDRGVDQPPARVDVWERGGEEGHWVGLGRSTPGSHRASSQGRTA